MHPFLTFKHTGSMFEPKQHKSIVTTELEITESNTSCNTRMQYNLLILVTNNVSRIDKFWIFYNQILLSTGFTTFFISSQVTKIVIHISKAFVKRIVLHSICKERRTKRQLCEDQTSSQIEKY